MLSRRRSVIVSLGIACVVGSCAAGEIHTPHYDVYVANGSADAYGQLLERFYPRLKSFFEKEPAQRLVVKLFPSYQDVVKESTRDGVILPSDFQPASFYASTSRVAYVITGPSDDDTVSTLLHECTHQYQGLAVMGSRQIRSDYYLEGIADHFAMHRGTGVNIQFELIPDILPMDRAGQALDDLAKRHNHSFRELAADARAFRANDRRDYAAGWALVEFVGRVHPKEFDRWSHQLEEADSPERAWTKVFGDASDEAITHEYIAWLESVRGTWRACGGEWSALGSTVSGSTPGQGGVCLLTLSDKVTELRATFRPEGDAAVGVVFDYQSPGSYRAILIKSNGEVEQWNRANDQWDGRHSIAQAQPDVDGLFRLEVRNIDGVVAVAISGQLIAAQKQTPGNAIGLAINTGTARFSDVSFK